MRRTCNGFMDGKFVSGEMKDEAWVDVVEEY